MQRILKSIIFGLATILGGWQSPGRQESPTFSFSYPSNGSVLSPSDIVSSFALSSKEKGKEVDAIILKLSGKDLEQIVLFTEYDPIHFKQTHYEEGKDDEGRRAVTALNPPCKHNNFDVTNEQGQRHYSFDGDPKFLPEGSYVAEAWVKFKSPWRNSDLKDKINAFQVISPTEVERVKQECDTKTRTQFKVDRTPPKGKTVELTENYAKIVFSDNEGFPRNIARRLRVYKINDDGLVDITEKTVINAESTGADLTLELKNYPCNPDELCVSGTDMAGNYFTFSPSGRDKEELRKK